MTVEKKKKSRTEPPEKRKMQLIDATLSSIDRYGISGTTMTSVTKIAGLSMGLANFHFKTKDALLEETLRHLAEEHRDHWARRIEVAELTPAQKVLDIVNAQFHPEICSRKKLRVWFAFFGAASQRKSYRAVTARIDSERLAALTLLLGQIIAHGEYENVRPEGVGRTLESLFDGFWLNMLMYPEVFSREDSLSQVTTYLTATFPGDFGPGAQLP